MQAAVSPLPRAAGLRRTGGADEADPTMRALAGWIRKMRATCSSSDGERQPLLVPPGPSDWPACRHGVAERQSLGAAAPDMQSRNHQEPSCGFEATQAQLTELQAELARAQGLIASLADSKAASEHTLLTEIRALRERIAEQGTEMQAFEASQVREQRCLEFDLERLQRELVSKKAEARSAHELARGARERAAARLGNMELTLDGLYGRLEASGVEGQSQAALLRRDIASLHGAMQAMSSNIASAAPRAAGGA
eukprot:gnl/TRDRNA2_/TRDRNA2_40429_c0_seq1.p1 gnl/TRDRNA2_/TRDRNA2_40429_c0~~gnl/TRDRNA2_/TRDRNA2_40429_c0_seq1.p1  ORF type:complete len:253 (+),score=51.49 gnl/TRDRNA2_/TRDRNA2_40429_c0_seq1:62-820(+)